MTVSVLRRRPRGTINYAVPSLIDYGNTGTGAGMPMSSSLIDDLLLLWQTSAGDLTVPTPPAGYTAFGSGAASDASGNDVAAILSAKKATANAEGFPASGPSRCVGVVMRNVVSDYLASLVGDYVYNSTPVAGLVIPGITPAWSGVVLVFSRLSGSANIPLAGLAGGVLQNITVANAGNGEARAARTIGAVSNFAGGTIGTSPVSTQSRVTMSVALPGRPL